MKGVEVPVEATFGGFIGGIGVLICGLSPFLFLLDVYTYLRVGDFEHLSGLARIRWLMPDKTDAVMMYLANEWAGLFKIVFLVFSSPSCVSSLIIGIPIAALGGFILSTSERR